MSVESTTTIAGLNALWPQGTDVKAEGDDHLRLIKSVLKADAVDKAQFATAVAATAQARNRIVNGGMQISQENGGTAGAVNGYFPADQWSLGLAGTGLTPSISRGIIVHPLLGPYYVHMNCSTTAKPSLAAGDFVLMSQTLEGTRIADLMWGNAAALPIVVRFTMQPAATGTYSLAIRNAATNRSYVAPIVVTTTSTADYAVVIPGDVTGTWPVDTSGALIISFSGACGATYQTGTPNTWVNGNFTGHTGMINCVATVNQYMRITRVGIHADPSSTGKPPAWVMPDEAQELLACMRYFQKYTIIVETSANSYSITYVAPMRIAPAFSGGGAGFAAAATSEFAAQLLQTTRGGPVLSMSARM